MCLLLVLLCCSIGQWLYSVLFIINKSFGLSVVFFPLKADRWPSNKCNAVEQWSPVDNHNFVIMFVRACDTENPQAYASVLTYMWKWRFQSPQFGSRVSAVYWLANLSAFRNGRRASSVRSVTWLSATNQRSALTTIQSTVSLHVDGGLSAAQEVTSVMFAARNTSINRI